MATTHDPFDFRIGDTWEISGPLQDSLGNALDLTDAAVTWKLDSLDGKQNILTLTLGAGIVIREMATATIMVTVPDELTATLAIGSYIDALRVALADGSIFTEWSGVIRIANPLV